MNLDLLVLIEEDPLMLAFLYSYFLLMTIFINMATLGEVI